MHQQRPALSGPWHVAWHIVLVLGGWGMFGGFWWLVLQQKSYPLAGIVWLLAGTLVILPLTTLYWVLHNRRIYARKGPRRQVQVVAAAYARDWAGRPVYAEFDALKSASLITVHSTADEKRFSTPSDAPPSHPIGKPHAQPVAA